jgi:hypothetical protein
MPYQARFNYDDKEKQNGTNISGQGGAAAVGIPGQDSAKPAKGSGQYANIQSYLEANKDQGDQMGGRVAGDVESKAQDAQSKISSFESKAPSVRAYDPNEAYNNLGNLSTEQKNEYKANKATGGYSGPQSLEQVNGYQDAYKASNEANQKVENAKSEIGQQQLLRDSYSRPSYSAGENKLDQVLLQNSPNSRSKLEELGQKYSGLNGLFNTASTKVGSAVNSAQAQALNNKKAIQEGEVNQFSSLINPIQQRADQLNAENPALFGIISSDLSDDTLSEETLSKLGLSDGQSLYDLNLSSYVTPNQTQLGVNDVANQNERTKYKQLADLFEDPSRTQIGNAGLNTDPLSFDKEKFNKDVEAKGKAYQNAYSNDKLFAGGATAKELEEIYIPRAKSLIANATNQFSRDQLQAALNAAQQQLQSFKDSYKNNRQVKKG